MVNAVNNKVNYRESNTEVIIKGANVFVRLYDTYIYAKVRGKVYFSDGGFNTATTSSRLRALGADYSAQKIVEKDCFIAPMASVNVLSFVCSFCVVQIFALVAKFEKLASIGSEY